MSIQTAKIIATVFNTFVPNSAAIAGGYVRDTFSGLKKPKDIDIIVEFHDYHDYQELHILANRFGYKTLVHGDSRYSSGRGDTIGQLPKVITLSKAGELNIDVIFCNCSVQELIDNFPCNASMFWLDGDIVRARPEAQEWFEDGRLKFYPGATEAYKKRMYDYFGSYTGVGK